VIDLQQQQAQSMSTLVTSCDASILLFRQHLNTALGFDLLQLLCQISFSIKKLAPKALIFDHHSHHTIMSPSRASADEHSKIDYSSASDEEFRPLTGKRQRNTILQKQNNPQTHAIQETSSPLFNDEDDSEFSSSDGYGRFKERQSLPLRTVLTAFFLFAVGVLFLGIAQHEIRHKSLSDATAFLIIGMIGMIPGAYATFIIVAVWLGIQGYSYDMVPTYD
jgi:hypothetical protein